MKTINSVFTFLFELLMLVSIFILAIHVIDNLVIALLVAIGVTAVTIFVWAKFLAPTSVTRLPITSGLLLASLLLTGGPVVFLIYNYNWLGFTILAVFVINRLVAIITRQW